ncbi:MAG: hypothetical protein RR138_00480 [Akkermansia sp.]
MDNSLPAPIYVTVACVLFGFDGTDFFVLLTPRLPNQAKGLAKKEFSLPADIVRIDENVDDVAARIAQRFIGMVPPTLSQFKVFGDPSQYQTEKNNEWIASQLKERDISVRMICIAYLSTFRISLDKHEIKGSMIKWCHLKQLSSLNFDHPFIVEDALDCVKKKMLVNPCFLYDLLMPYFTATELRKLVEIVMAKKMDVRNFYKKMEARRYLVPTDKKEKDVAHRAARYYKFDADIFRKQEEEYY